MRMAQQASRKRKLSHGAEAPLPRVYPSGFTEDDHRWPQATGSVTRGHQYHDVVNQGSSRSHFGDVHNYNVTNNSYPSQTEDDKKLATFRSALWFSRMDFRYATIDPAHNETCQWILDTGQYQRWRNEAFRGIHHGFLWIKGKPGVGKSTIMKFLLEHMKRNMLEHTVISFFFNARGTSLEMTTEGLYRSLLFQLLEEFKVLRNTIKVPHAVRKGQKWAVESVQDLFREALSHLRTERLILIIDALDEGDHRQVRKMVGYLASLASSTGSHFATLDTCFASRHFPNISMRHCEEIIMENQARHMSDIRTYIHENLVLQPQPPGLIDEIQRKSKAVFLWVVLVVRSLNQLFDEGASVDQLKSSLEVTPAGLDDLLTDVFRAGASDRYFLPTLQWVLAGTGHLDIVVLYYGIQLAVEHLTTPACEGSQVDLATMERFVIHSSKGLIELKILDDKGPPQYDIHFIHETVREFLLSGGLESVNSYPTGNMMADSHAMLADCCQSYLRLNMPKYLGVPMDEAGDMVDIHLYKHEDSRAGLEAYDMFPLLRYVQENTFEHIATAYDAGAYELQALQHFPLQEWINMTNVTEIEGFYLLRPATILHLLLLEKCYTLVKKLLSLYQISVNRARMGEAGGSLTDDSYVHIFVGHSFYTRCGGHCGTPLIAAVAYKHTELVHMLLECGADVNLADARSSPLGRAVEQGDVETARLLLQCGASVNCEGGLFGTPLGSAAWHGRLDCMELLLKYGANVNQKSEIGRNIALQQSIGGKGPHDAVIAMLLSDHRARFSVQDLTFPLMLASGRRLLHAIYTLVGFCADPNGRDEHSMTALHVAAGAYRQYRSNPKLVERSASTVQVLLELGADVNAIGGEHGTALIAASASGEIGAVSLLLDYKANVHYRSAKYGTAIEVARAGRHAEIINMLLAAGSHNYTQSGAHGAQVAPKASCRIHGSE